MYDNLTMLNLQNGSNWTGPNNWYHPADTITPQHGTDGCVDDLNVQMAGAGEGVVQGERDESLPSQSTPTYSCMLPPSPSALPPLSRKFDSSSYTSPRLPPPPTASANTGFFPGVSAAGQTAVQGGDQELGQGLGQYWTRLQ
uniref:Uncharacterized protein n=1 Tax=Sinocyclocheilus grahami TaxID=75366 RepID=A0A672TAB1_SINGR